MKKVLTYAKKYDNLIVILIIILFLSTKVYNVQINNNDELINFLNTYKMANGLTIYKDTNVIITPLFFYVGKILLNIFGTNLLVFRTYNLIISTLLYFLVYQILKAFKINKKLSFFYTVLIIRYTYSIVGAGANYNILAYCIYELGVLLILKMKEGSKKDICQGAILFLVFFANHKLAVGYFIAIVIYNLINKNIKSLVKQLSVSASLLAIFLIALYAQGNLYNFINYTVLGIKEFAEKNVAKDNYFIENVVFILITIFTIITYGILLKIINKKEDKKTFKIMLIFSTCALIIILPIFNYYHFALANILMAISLAYALNYLVTPLADDIFVPLIISMVTLMFAIIMCIESIWGMNVYVGLLKVTENTSPFYGSYIEKETREELDRVSTYMQNNKKHTIMLSTYAPFYSIKLKDLDNSVYDWALRGNLGKEGENGLIEKIKELKNTQILLYKSDEENSEIYQFAYGAIDYIKKNMSCIGRVGRFDIYETID